MCCVQCSFHLHTWSMHMNFKVFHCGSRQAYTFRSQLVVACMSALAINNDYSMANEIHNLAYSHWNIKKKNELIALLPSASAPRKWYGLNDTYVLAYGPIGTYIQSMLRYDGTHTAGNNNFCAAKTQFSQLKSRCELTRVWERHDKSRAYDD